MAKQKSPEVGRSVLGPAEKEALDVVIKAMRKAFRKDGFTQALEVPLTAARHYRSSSNRAKRRGGDISAQRCAGAVGVVDLLDGEFLNNLTKMKEQSKVKAPAPKRKKAAKNI